MLCQAQVILIPNYLISFENPCFLFPLANTQGSRVKVVNLWLFLSFSDAHLVQRQIITSPGCPTRGGNTTTNWASSLLRWEDTKMWLMFGAKSFQATCRTALIGNFEYLGAWLSLTLRSAQRQCAKSCSPQERSLRAQKLPAHSCEWLGYDCAQTP